MLRRLLAAASLALLATTTLAHAGPDPQALLRNADRARGGGLPGVVWDIHLNSQEDGKAGEPQRLTVRATDQASVAETQEPARFKGSRLLQVERNMWLTRPGLSKPIPISPRQRMSGQAANGDIAATNYALDYEATLAGNETVDGEDCAVLELNARHKRTTYDRIRYWVSASRGVGVKAEFLSVSGKLLKTAYFEYAHTIQHDGRQIPFVSRMRIRDALTDGETVMEFRDVRIERIAPDVFDLGQSQ
jgi:hypothetical protein